jgi:hypothetical protein
MKELRSKAMKSWLNNGVRKAKKLNPPPEGMMFGLKDFNARAADYFLSKEM